MGEGNASQYFFCGKSSLNNSINLYNIRVPEILIFFAFSLNLSEVRYVRKTFFRRSEVRYVRKTFFKK